MANWPFLIFLAPLGALYALDWGPYWMYPISMMVILMCIYKLGQHVDDRWTLSLMVWIPIVGLLSWQRQILHMDLAYISPQQGIIHIAKLIWQSHQLSWSLLLIGSAFLHLFHKAWAWMLTLSLGCHLISGVMIEDLVQHLSMERFQEAEWSILIIEGIRWLPTISIIWLWPNESLIRRLIILVMCTLQLWISAPFVGLLLWSAPATHPIQQGNLPTSEIVLGSTIPSANPLSENFTVELDAQGSGLLPRAGWWCNSTPKIPWQNRLRAYAVIEMDSESTLETLHPHLPEIMNRGISELGILQRTSQRIEGVFLQKHLEYPVQHWLMDPPPETASIAYWDGQTVQWQRVQSEQCAVWIPWSATLQQVTNIYQQLHTSGHCVKPYGVIFGEMQKVWRPPIPCPFENPPI